MRWGKVGFDSLLGIFQFGILLKVFFSVLGLFYLVLVAVIYKQITLMTQVLKSPVSPLLQTAAMVQIAAGGILLLLAIVLG